MSASVRAAPSPRAWMGDARARKLYPGVSVELVAQAWVVISWAYLRVQLADTGRTLADAPQGERDHVIERFTAEIESDVAAVVELLRVAQAQRTTTIRRKLHSREGVDHEMVDEALEDDGA